MVLLEAFGANVHIVRRSSASYRRLQLYGSDGRVRHMLVQTGQNWSQNSTDERVVQLMRLINRLLEAHPQARSRGLALHTPLLVTCWPQVRKEARGAGLRKRGRELVRRLLGDVQPWDWDMLATGEQEGEIAPRLGWRFPRSPLPLPPHPYS